MDWERDREEEEEDREGVRVGCEGGREEETNEELGERRVVGGESGINRTPEVLASGAGGTLAGE